MRLIFFLALFLYSCTVDINKINNLKNDKTSKAGIIVTGENSNGIILKN